MRDVIDAIFKATQNTTNIRSRRIIWGKLIPIFSGHGIPMGEYISRDIGYDQAYTILFPSIDCTPERLMIAEKSYEYAETDIESGVNRQTEL